MAKKINYEVIDQMFSAVLSANESIKYGMTVALMA